MYNLLFKLILVAACVKLGFSMMDFQDCHSKECLQKIDKAIPNVLKIDWKPISVFPEEGKRFK